MRKFTDPRVLRYFLAMARAQFGPKTYSPKRRAYTNFNRTQECIRRLRFIERHGTAPGGGPVWQG
ncbi:MAG: hypothetical protein WC356_02390 [Candidatus Micrarchaeia archaeon]